MTDVREDLSRTMQLLLVGVSFGDALEVLLDLAAAVIVTGAPDREIADLMAGSSAEALVERVGIVWAAVSAPAAIVPGPGTMQ